MWVINGQSLPPTTSVRTVQLSLPYSDHVGRCWQVQVVLICFVCYSVKSKRCGWTRGCTPISSTPTCHWWVYTTLRISFITICAFLMLLAVIYVPPFFSYYLIYFLFYPHGYIKFKCYQHLQFYRERNSLCK